MMETSPSCTHLLVLPHLRIQNANAISSPLTHGFPSMTAFLGLMWALERKAVSVGIDSIAFNSIGVVSHAWQEQVTEAGYIKSFCLNRNPVGKDGGTTAIVEEGRIHLELSLVFGLTVEDWDEDRRSSDIAQLAELVSEMRVAGGTIQPPMNPSQMRQQPWLVNLTGTSEDQQKHFRKMCMRLLPGSVLVARDDLIDRRLSGSSQTSPGESGLDVWLSLSRINWHYDADGNGGKGAWQGDRKKGDGWLVPMPVGYGSISDLYVAGSVAHARDATTDFRFVESLYSVGEWIGVHRLRLPSQMLWYANNRPNDGVYRCRNDYRPSVEKMTEITIA